MSGHHRHHHRVNRKSCDTVLASNHSGIPMALKFAAICSLVVSAASILAQQPNPSAPASTSVDRKPSEKIYEPGPDITAPVLLPSHPLQISTDKCKKKFKRNESVEFSAFISSDGKARRIVFIHPIGNEMDQVALDLVHADQFTPAVRNKETVAVWQEIDINLQSCREDATDSHPFPQAGLIEQPVQKLTTLKVIPPVKEIAAPVGIATQPQKIGGSVWAPVPLSTPEAHYSIEARRKRIQGACLVSMVVDAEGMPQNPHLVHPLGYGLDDQALIAVRRYRFKPAMKNGMPVAVMLSVEVNFRLV
jgi:TonB family protein